MTHKPAPPGIVWVDYLDELHAAIARAGGNEAYAAKLGIPLRAVWQARDQDPAIAVLQDLGLSHAEGYYRYREAKP